MKKIEELAKIEEKIFLDIKKENDDLKNVLCNLRSVINKILSKNTNDELDYIMLEEILRRLKGLLSLKHYIIILKSLCNISFRLDEIVKENAKKLNVKINVEEKMNVKDFIINLNNLTEDEKEQILDFCTKYEEFASVNNGDESFVRAFIALNNIESSTLAKLEGESVSSAKVLK